MTPASPSVRSVPALGQLAGMALSGIACLSGAACDSHRILTVDERSAAVPMQSDEFAKLGYRVEWRGFPTLLAGSSVVQFDILGDAVGALDSTGVFTVLDARGGSLRWSDQPSGPLTRFYGSTRAGGNILLTSETETYVYDAASGTLNAKHATPQVVSTRVTKVGELLIYGAPSGTLLALTASNGFEAWTSGVDGAIETDPITFGNSSLLAVASNAGEVLVLDGATGQGVGRSKIFGGPGAPLAHSDTLVFIASTDHSLYAVTRESAQILWRYRTEAPLSHAPLYRDGKVYADLGEEGLSSLDSATGKKAWSNKDVHGDAIGFRKGKLLVFSAGKAVIVDPANGAAIDTVQLKEISMLRPEALSDSPLYAVSPLGVITRLVPR